MAEVLTRFTEPISSSEGVRYAAQACAAANSDGLWEGWIEFVPDDGSTAIRSPRETTQPNRVDAEYWASGLSRVYLEGALARALRPVVIRKTAPPAQALFDEPARRGRSSGDVTIPPSAVLDPFSVYQKGESILRQELSALSAWHLVNIIRAYQLSSDSQAALERRAEPALADLIVSGVRSRALAR